MEATQNEREKNDKKTSTKLTRKSQEPVVELLEAIGGKVDGLRGRSEGRAERGKVRRRE